MKNSRNNSKHFHLIYYGKSDAVLLGTFLQLILKDEQKDKISPEKDNRKLFALALTFFCNA